MSNLKRIEKVDAKTVLKGWGKEHVFANNERYCGKLLIFTKDGYEGSTHFHLKKHEHFHVLSGLFEIQCINGENASKYFIRLWPGDTIEIPPGQPHRIICEKAGTILEVSTPDSPEDSYRVERGESQV